jgi:hypothetical protein
MENGVGALGKLALFRCLDAAEAFASGKVFGRGCSVGYSFRCG